MFSTDNTVNSSNFTDSVTFNMSIRALNRIFHKSVKNSQQWRQFHVSRTLSNASSNAKVGIVGMGHVGNAVCHNLLRNGFTVTAITDIKAENCQGYPESIEVKGSAREVAEMSDIVVSGK